MKKATIGLLALLCSSAALAGSPNIIRIGAPIHQAGYQPSAEQLPGDEDGEAPEEQAEAECQSIDNGALWVGYTSSYSRKPFGLVYLEWGGNTLYQAYSVDSSSGTWVENQNAYAEQVTIGGYTYYPNELAYEAQDYVPTSNEYTTFRFLSVCREKRGYPDDEVDQSIGQGAEEEEDLGPHEWPDSQEPNEWRDDPSMSNSPWAGIQHPDYINYWKRKADGEIDSRGFTCRRGGWIEASPSNTSVTPGGLVSLQWGPRRVFIAPTEEIAVPEWGPYVHDAERAYRYDRDTYESSFTFAGVQMDVYGVCGGWLY